MVRALARVLASYLAVERRDGPHSPPFAATPCSSPARLYASGSSRDFFPSLCSHSGADLRAIERHRSEVPCAGLSSVRDSRTRCGGASDLRAHPCRGRAIGDAGAASRLGDWMRRVCGTVAARLRVVKTNEVVQTCMEVARIFVVGTTVWVARVFVGRCSPSPRTQDFGTCSQRNARDTRPPSPGHPDAERYRRRPCCTPRPWGCHRGENTTVVVSLGSFRGSSEYLRDSEPAFFD